MTAFEKALEHFGLTDIYDCKKLTKAENAYKKYLYEEKFGDMPSK